MYQMRKVFQTAHEQFRQPGAGVPSLTLHSKHSESEGSRDGMSHNPPSCHLRRIVGPVLIAFGGENSVESSGDFSPEGRGHFKEPETT